MRKTEDRYAYLHQKVAHWAARVKVAPACVRVQRMTRKWGSCSATGTITLADDLAEETAGFQDFVIVHELLHLRFANHGKVFKALMSVYVPDWRKYELTDHPIRAKIHSVSSRVGPTGGTAPGRRRD